MARNVRRVFSRKGAINSEFATASISRFFYPPSKSFVHSSARSSSFSFEKTDGETFSACLYRSNVPFSLHHPHTRSARILRRFPPFSLIHSFTLFLPALSPLNLYAAAYLARFLPVIDAHSIRLRTPVRIRCRAMFLSLITSLAAWYRKRRMAKARIGGGGEGEREARWRLVSFHSGRRTN